MVMGKGDQCWDRLGSGCQEGKTLRQRANAKKKQYKRRGSLWRGASQATELFFYLTRGVPKATRTYEDDLGSEAHLADVLRDIHPRLFSPWVRKD